ncbi:MAG: hypothetical protein LBH13_07685 [Cellulomonadaceae bacterium]|jgi:hypothetical protein|nr:hypothetical protein [Cellulomonadaceae bacterium]
MNSQRRTDVKGSRVRAVTHFLAKRRIPAVGVTAIALVTAGALLASPLLSGPGTPHLATTGMHANQNTVAGKLPGEIAASAGLSSEVASKVLSALPVSVSSLTANVGGLMAEVTAPSCGAFNPPAVDATTARIIVTAGDERNGTATSTPLAGVTFGLFTRTDKAPYSYKLVSGTEKDCPADNWAVAISGADGKAVFAVPNTQAKSGTVAAGANNGKQYFVKAIAAPKGYFLNPALAAGSDSSPTQSDYAYQAPALAAGKTYQSGADFMKSDSGDTRSLGVWAISRNNPAMPETCKGLKVAMILDTSNSITNAKAVDDVKNAAKSFVTSFNDSSMKMDLFSFHTVTVKEKTGLTELTPGTSGGTETLKKKIDAIAFSHSGNVDTKGDVQKSTGTSAGGTNWDRAFNTVASELTGSQKYDLAVFVTDGMPTVSDANFTYNQNPFFYYTERAIASANLLKSKGTRISVLGVGPVGKAQPNLEAVASNDAVITSGFKEAADAIKHQIFLECTPSVEVTKYVQTWNGKDGYNEPELASQANPWNFDATVQESAKGFKLFSAGATTTNNSGTAKWAFEAPEDITKTGSVAITERTVDGWSFVPEKTVCLVINGNNPKGRSIGSSANGNQNGPTMSAEENGLTLSGIGYNDLISCSVLNRQEGASWASEPVINASSRGNVEWNVTKQLEQGSVVSVTPGEGELFDYTVVVQARRAADSDFIAGGSVVLTAGSDVATVGDLLQATFTLNSQSVRPDSITVGEDTFRAPFADEVLATPVEPGDSITATIDAVGVVGTSDVTLTVVMANGETGEASHAWQHATKMNGPLAVNVTDTFWSGKVETVALSESQAASLKDAYSTVERFEYQQRLGDVTPNTPGSFADDSAMTTIPVCMDGIDTVNPNAVVSYTNVAAIKTGSTVLAEDQETARVCSNTEEPPPGPEAVDPTVEVTMSGSHTVTYDWSIVKEINKDTVETVVRGQGTPFEFTVTVTAVPAVKDIVATGQVTLTNPNVYDIPMEEITFGSSDSALTFTTEDTVIPAGGTATVTLNWSAADRATAPSTLISAQVLYQGVELFSDVVYDPATAAVTAEGDRATITDTYAEFGGPVELNAADPQASAAWNDADGAWVFNYVAFRGVTMAGADDPTDNPALCGVTFNTDTGEQESTNYTNVVAVQVGDDVVAEAESTAKVCVDPEPLFVQPGSASLYATGDENGAAPTGDADTLGDGASVETTAATTTSNTVNQGTMPGLQITGDTPAASIPMLALTGGSLTIVILAGIFLGSGSVALRLPRKKA